MVDAERYNLANVKDDVKCPFCEGDVYVLFKHGPLSPGQNIGYALECFECSKIFHLDEVGKIHLK